jgi:hypothetical protein
MTKPSDDYSFATDGGATSDPGPTRRATGFVAGKKVPAKWINWALNGASKWSAYLGNLHAEPDFLNKSYTWTAAHAFAAGIAGALSITGSVQAQSYLYDAPKLRTIMVPLTSFNLFNAWSVFDDADNGSPYFGVYMIASLADQRTYAHVRLPHAAQLREVRAQVAGGGVEMSISRLRWDKVATVPARDLVGQAAGAGSATVLSVAPPLLSAPIIDGATDLVSIAFRSTAPGLSRVYWVELQYLDYGPHNH